MEKKKREFPNRLNQIVSAETEQSDWKHDLRRLVGEDYLYNII